MCKMTFIQPLAFKKGFEYRSSDLQVLNNIIFVPSRHESYSTYYT